MDILFLFLLLKMKLGVYMSKKVNDKSIWNEIYEKEEFKPGWSSPGTDPNLISIIGDCLKQRCIGSYKMLDIGCGNGRNSMIVEEFPSYALEYTGADFADKAVEFCKGKYSGSKKFVHLDITEDNLPLDDHYDIIIDCGCFHSIPPEARAAYLKNVSKRADKSTLYIIGAWYREKEHIETKEPSYFPYLYLDEWFLNSNDIRDIFGKEFNLLFEIIDNQVYNGLNKGFAYFILRKC